MMFAERSRTLRVRPMRETRILRLRGSTALPLRMLAE